MSCNRCTASRTKPRDVDEGSVDDGALEVKRASNHRAGEPRERDGGGDKADEIYIYEFRLTADSRAVKRKREKEKEKERVRRDRQSPRRRRRRGACVRACVRVRAADHPVLRRTRRRRIADVRHDDGDSGLRGGAVQHILGARRADMLLRGLPLYHEVRKAALYEPAVSFSLSFHLSVRPFLAALSAILRVICEQHM